MEHLVRHQWPGLAALQVRLCAVQFHDVLWRAALPCVGTQLAGLQSLAC
jgi:hypothetical protein